MGACYLCGVTEKHSNDCPRFISPINVKIMPTFADGEGNFWCIDVILPGEIIPIWAARAWILDNYEDIGKDVSPFELAKAWEVECKRLVRQPGWALINEKIGLPGAAYDAGSTGMKLAVFGPFHGHKNT